MKPSSPLVGQLVNRRESSAFTLIELIAVMTIILLLAGLILSIAGHAQYQGSVKRAESEIKAMEGAIEAYKIDNGSYPRVANGSTDNLNPQQDFDPAFGAGPKYQQSCEYLYQCLSGLQPASMGSRWMNSAKHGR